MENYVGRQIPTAMVARNLDRGSGFLNPRLDTAPFPNHFWVEPPIYAQAVVAFRRLMGLPLEPAGRLVSALAMTLGAWGLFGLARRRDGDLVALVALAAFAIFPLNLRYGRSFQPDALMVGCFLAGFRCWDHREHGEGRAWIIPAAILLALGLSLKVVWAAMLIPLLFLRGHDTVASPEAGEQTQARTAWPILGKLAALGLLLIPALLWYGYVAFAIGQGGGSRASADNRAIWMRVLIPTALFEASTWNLIARFLCLRAFTPVGFLLGAAGVVIVRGLDPFWRAWTAAVLLTLGILAAKLHHEYYWMMLAPVMAVVIGRSIVALGRWQRCLGIAAGLTFLLFSIFQARSTWRTPPEWTSIREAARVIQEHVPEDALVVAPEALLFEADRRGCRLELTGEAAWRAAGEWGGTLDRRDPLELVAFYKSKGARYFGDVRPDDPARRGLHDAIMGRYKVLVDRPGVLLADLAVTEEAPDGTR
ncbi:ArnT family glycosyltransferase [Singulisphaera sp. PoT]|uniref:ArnT family glycosyltransferase n=1 Tax=Singulisphaera sp. PoT TaxID=3411797 RepID=UPI003BF58FD6